MNELQKAENFLEKDLPDAMKHYKCCWTCIYKTGIALASDNFELAEARMIDLQRSLNELKRLKERKQQYDQMKELAIKLQNQGINVENILRKGNRQ